MTSNRYKTFIKTVLAVIIAILFYVIISDWANFKAGLMGEPYRP